MGIYLSEYLHVFNRGKQRATIFFNTANYIYFLRRLNRSAFKYSIQVEAYCLMPNHFHLLLRNSQLVPISGFLNSLLGGYSQALNKERKRSGSVFERSTKTKAITDQRYLLQVLMYIHLNPVVAKLVAHPAEWAFSDSLHWLTRSRAMRGADLDLDIDGADYQRLISVALNTTPQEFQTLAG